MSNLFPEDMQGSLNWEILIQLRLCKELIQQCDSVSFLQLLWSICDSKRPGISNDMRESFFTSVGIFTNIYMIFNSTTEYRHKWNNTNVSKRVHFLGMLVIDGILGEQSSSLLLVGSYDHPKQP